MASGCVVGKRSDEISESGKDMAGTDDETLIASPPLKFLFQMFHIQLMRSGFERSKPLGRQELTCKRRVFESHGKELRKRLLISQSVVVD